MMEPRARVIRETCSCCGEERPIGPHWYVERRPEKGPGADHLLCPDCAPGRPNDPTEEWRIVPAALLIMEDDGTGFLSGVEAFTKANEDGLAPEDLAAVRALVLGAELVFGGGAMPVVTVRRIS